MSIDTERLRCDEFSWMREGATFMNAASTGPLPQRSVDAQVDFTRRRATPHLVPFEDQFGALARCRALVAAMINAKSGDIALAVNTGMGINLAAWGLPIGVGDEVVVSDGEFPANMYPWLAAAESRGFTVHVVPLRDGLMDPDAMLAALDRPNVRLLSVSWVGSVTGVRADLDVLSAASRRRGVYFIVDAIQGLGALTLDVARTPIDVLACGAQKWLLGPWGAGFTYIRPDVLSSITPQPVSWMGVRDSDDFSRLLDYDLTWREDARRFEMVTLPYQDFAGMAASLTLLQELGINDVAAHIHACTARLLEGARERGVELVTPAALHGGIASLRPSNALAVSDRLNLAGVVHSVREGTIRLAPHCYTNDADIEITLRSLSS